MPSFDSIILKDGGNFNLLESTSLTDAGLCTTLNGNSMINTFNVNNNRMKEFIEILVTPTNNTFEAVKISGTSSSHTKKVFLNVRDFTGKQRGTIHVALNDWKDSVSVRYVCTGFSSLVITIFKQELKLSKNMSEVEKVGYMLK
jgi:membrane protease subunit (stomatin/prohibitin family)